MIEGVFPALITPFTKDDELDEGGLRRIVEYVEEGGVDGIVPCGTTGESATLSFEEHKRAVEVVIDCAKTKVIAGTGSNSTSEALELTKHAADAGADACLLITPYYNKPNKKGLIEHFKRIADAVDIPLILYNIPSRTGLNMTADVVVQLASETENIKGIKEASGDLKQVQHIIKEVRERDIDFTVISGDDILTIPIMSVGGKGVISVIANILPRETSEMVHAMLKGDYAKALEMNYRLLPLIDAMFLETNPIPVKRAAELIGLPAGHTRLPLGGLSEENERKLREVLKSFGLTLHA
ncbi:4-hydroxy-tetrahydrodipicolinate synthase [Methanosarcinales archaeon]|nr:MAG: 4-hydroxy-tetrahydrodipicolinate synthase [Methanosarcinales archaeon]